MISDELKQDTATFYAFHNLLLNHLSVKGIVVTEMIYTVNINYH